MSSKGKGTKRTIKDAEHDIDEVNLFARMTTKDKNEVDESDSDTTDSEESQYSGLDEEEEDSSDDEMFQELSDSLGTSSDDEDDEDDDEGEDDMISKQEDAETDKSNIIVNKKNNAKTLNDKSSPEKLEVSNKNIPASEDTKTSELSAKHRKKKGKSKNSLPDNVKHKMGSGSEPSSSTGGSIVTAPDEYTFDSSDEEDLRNTVGNIPMEWYREYEHIGYNLEGNKIIKPPTGDELDNFLNKMDNPNYWRTIVDKTTGQNVVLSEKDCEMIKRFRRGKYVDSKVDPYEPWIDFFTYEKMLHPVTNRPEHKRSFIPSKWEKLKVGRMVHAIKMGWMKPHSEKKEKDVPDYYMLWKTDEQPDITRTYRSNIPAPKLSLPGHEESYNPPPEYVLTEEEELAWNSQEPEDRRMKFLPKKYSSLRQVPGYDRFINERFERCLDLYLCPRQRKTRMRVNAEDLLPKLPKPKDLQPFPTTQSIVYTGHTNIVRCISVDPGGQWLVSGCDDETLKFWEVSTGRCMKTLNVTGIVKSVAWNPNPSLCLVAAVAGSDVFIINPGLGDKLVIANTDTLIGSYLESDTTDNAQATWQMYTSEKAGEGFRLKITHFKDASYVTWHGRGDYMAVVMPTGESKAVVIHQLSKRRSQNPFRKSKGLIQCVLFHPTRPFLFVATQRYVRIYNLLKQELSKKLLTNVKWVSSMAVHPGGDNVIIGSYDCKLGWFDLDLSTKPYQMLRHHKKAIRQVCYHKKYPLFASSSDDGSIIICHGRVYNDLLQNPLIVPVKVLRGHAIQNSLGVLSCEFHPTQPWIFSSGSDHTIRLFT